MVEKLCERHRFGFGIGSDDDSPVVIVKGLSVVAGFRHDGTIPEIHFMFWTSTKRGHNPLLMHSITVAVSIDCGLRVHPRRLACLTGTTADGVVVPLVRPAVELHRLHAERTSR